MATFDLQKKLKDKPTIKSRSGGLYQTSEEELSSLTGNLPAAPITPLGANMVGANADQAKMVGSKAQKIPALREALQAGAGQNLADAQRTKQVSGVVSGEDEAKKAQAKALSGLSSFDTRVDELKEAKVQQAAAQTIKAQVFDPTKAAANPTLQAALTKLNANPNDQQAILEANQALGNTAANLMTADQLKVQYGANQGALAAGAAAQAVSNAKGADLTLAQLSNMGFSDLNTLAGAIGADPSQIANMSVSDIARAAQSRLTTDFGDVASLQSAASDPYAGAAARADARGKLREMGATGIRSVESDIDVLADDLSNALTVSVGGKEMSIEDALSDDTISDFIQQYVDASPEDKKKMEQSEPALTGFVKKHEGIFQEASAELAKGMKTFEDTQAQRAKAGEIAPGASLNADLVAMIDPSASGLGVSAVDLASKSKLFKDLTSNPNIQPQDKVAVTSALNEIGSKNPKIAKDLLSKYDFADLAKMGLNTPEGSQKFLSKLTSANFISKLTPTSSPDEVSQALGFNSKEELEKSLGEAKMMEMSGFFGKDKGLDNLKGLIFRKKDGSIDTAATINALKGATPSDNALQIAGWKNAPMELKGTLGTYSGQSNEAFNNVKAQVSDGVVSRDELPAVTKHINPANFLDYAPAFANMPSKVQDEAVLAVVNKIPGAGDLQSVIKDLSNRDFAVGNTKVASKLNDRYGGIQTQIEDMEAQAKKAGKADLAAALHGQARNLANALAAYNKTLSIEVDKKLQAEANAAAKSKKTATGTLEIGPQEQYLPADFGKTKNSSFDIMTTKKKSNPKLGVIDLGEE